MNREIPDLYLASAVRKMVTMALSDPTTIRRVPFLLSCSNCSGYLLSPEAASVVHSLQSPLAPGGGSEAERRLL